MVNVGKKCIPGVFCIDNLLLFFIVVILILLVYMQLSASSTSSPVSVFNIIPKQAMGGISTRQDPINDPYSPPMSSAGFYFPSDSGDIRGGIPVNMRTRGMLTQYQQVGILTRQGRHASDNILPLMGRQVATGRDMWQYYTMTNTGNLNTKLPIRVNGRSCTSEYGCASINDGDNVYVEGYNDSFQVTLYENNLLQYIPF